MTPTIATAIAISLTLTTSAISANCLLASFIAFDTTTGSLHYFLNLLTLSPFLAFLRVVCITI